VSQHDTPYLFDARSAAWPRTTGWERYTREIASRISIAEPRVRVRVAGAQGIASRVWQDAVATPAAVRGTRVAHFPTLPPVPWVRPSTALVFTLHDLTWWRWRETASRMGRHYYAPLARAALKGGAHIVTCTQTVAHEVMSDFGLDETTVSVVPNGVELPAAADIPPRPRPYLVSVGTLEPRKNLAKLAAAYRLSGMSATHDMVVVGRIGWAELPPGLTLLSGLDDAQLVATYRGATALVLPSLYEGFGLPAVEAMQLGIPVICSDIPVLREVTGGHATYVDATSVDALAEALRAAPQAVATQDGAQWARTTYTWDGTVAELSRLYRRLDTGAAR